MFLSRNKKNSVYPCKPQFYHIKVGFNGVNIIQACFRDVITILLASFGKIFFAWRFTLNDYILFWLTLSYQKLFFLLCALFSNKNLKIKFIAKHWYDLYQFLFRNF